MNDLQIFRQLNMLREAGLKVAREDEPEASLAGYCAAMACTVHGCLGGEILEGYVDDMAHYWNRLPSGEEVDLTSCQFGGNGMTPVTEGKSVPVPEFQDPAVLMFAFRIKEAL